MLYCVCSVPPAPLFLRAAVAVAVMPPAVYFAVRFPGIGRPSVFVHASRAIHPAAVSVAARLADGSEQGPESSEHARVVGVLLVRRRCEKRSRPMPPPRDPS